MFFITVIDFWIHRLEEHMQKVILESFGLPHAASVSKFKVSTEWLILNLFKIENTDLPLKEFELKQPTPQLLTELSVIEHQEINAAQKPDLSSYSMQFGNQKIQFDLAWQDVINKDHDFLFGKINEFFNPSSTTLSLKQFKLLLVFRLQQQCLQLREEAYLRLSQRDTLQKEIKETERAVSELKKQVEQQEKEKTKEKEKEKKQKLEEPKEKKILENSAQEKPEEPKESPEKIAFDKQMELLAKQLESLTISAKVCSDKTLLEAVASAINNTKSLMQKLEEKSAYKVNQITVTPSNGRTGALLRDFAQTLTETFLFFEEVDKKSDLSPNQTHAFLDCSPKKVFKKNDPLLIVYEHVVPYLLSNYCRSANFDRLSQDNAHNSTLVNMASSFISLTINPVKTISDKVTLWTYDSKVAEEKRNLLSKIILSLRTSVSGQALKTQEKKMNQGIWDNCERTLLLESEQASKTQGYSYSPWPQQLTIFFDQTKQSLKTRRAHLNQQSLSSSVKNAKIAK